MKYSTKTIISILVIFILMLLPTVVQAEGIGDVFDQAGRFISNGQNNSEPVATKETADIIYNVLLAIGTVLAVAVGGILGIKFMISSAEDKAKVKEALVPYILGCVVIFGAFGIWKVTVNIGNSFSSSSSEIQQNKNINANLEAGEIIQKIQSGQIDVTDEAQLSNEKLLEVYNQNKTRNNILTLKNGDARGNNTTMTAQQAIKEYEKIHPAEVAVYREGVSRGILNEIK